MNTLGILHRTTRKMGAVECGLRRPVVTHRYYGYSRVVDSSVKFSTRCHRFSRVHNSPRLRGPTRPKGRHRLLIKGVD